MSLTLYKENYQSSFNSLEETGFRGPWVQLQEGSLPGESSA